MTDHSLNSNEPQKTETGPAPTVAGGTPDASAVSIVGVMLVAAFGVWLHGLTFDIFAMSPWHSVWAIICMLMFFVWGIAIGQYEWTESAKSKPDRGLGTH